MSQTATLQELERGYLDGRLHETIRLASLISGSRREPTAAAKALGIASNAAFEAGDILTAIRLHREILALEARDEFREARLDAALAVFARESQFQSTEDAVANLSQARQLAAESGTAGALGRLHLSVARLDAMRGVYASARRHLHLSRQLLETGNPLAMAAVHIVDSALESYVGNLGLAIKAAEASLTASKASSCHGAVAGSMANLGSILFLTGDRLRSEELLSRVLAMTAEMLLLRTVVLDTRAQATLVSGDLPACADLLAECAALISRHKVPARSWYDLMHQGTRCAFFERQEDWQAIVDLVDEVEPEVTRRQYRALRTTLVCAKARAHAAIGDRERADRALAAAVAACPRGAVDPLIVLEATRAACDVFAGRAGAARSRFERALAGCRAIGHRYHERWILNLRERLMPSTVAVATNGSPVASTGEVVADIAAILGAGNSIDLLAHRTSTLLHSTPVGDRVEITPTGEQEHHAQPSVEVHTDAKRFSITLRAADRRVDLTVPDVDTLDDVVLLKNVGDIVRLAVTRAADAEQDDDTPNLWPTSPVAEDGDAVFRSPRMVEVLRVAARLADTPMPVLITGETGTGKEILARFIHANSPSRRGPFVPFASPAVARELVESHLFGHRRGAFTGALENSQGMIRAAQGGTLFIDEVGDLEAAVQPKLLRFIEYGEIQPVGDAKPQSVKVRLVAATNVDLEAHCRDGRFRRDLFYRLNVARLVLPPLRERKDEIPAMAHMFLARASRECGRAGLKLSDDFVAALLLYDWPGNIRELFNEVRRAVALASDGDTLTARDLAGDVARPWLERPVSVAVPASDDGVFVRLDQPLGQAIRQIEEQFIARALDVSGGRVSDAARILGLSRKGLFLKRRRRARIQAAATGTSAD